MRAIVSSIRVSSTYNVQQPLGQRNTKFTTAIYEHNLFELATEYKLFIWPSNTFFVTFTTVMRVSARCSQIVCDAEGDGVWLWCYM